MSIEIMLYIYLFICASMIIFDIVTAFVLRREDKRVVKVSEDFRERVDEQLKLMKLGRNVDADHKEYLLKKLKRVSNMTAFDNMLEDAYKVDRDSVRRYLSQLDSVFISLTDEYSSRDQIEAAYFPYIIKKYHLISDNPSSSIVDAMFRMLNEPYLYSRENAMQALYTTGDCECIIRALKCIDRSEYFFHSKLLGDGLLNFTGDGKELCDRIIEEFEDFSVDMQVTLLNFFRFSTGDYTEFAFSLLQDESRDDEIHYSCIRYLGKYPYKKAYGMLCFLADKSSAEKWQYSAIASSALANYPCERTKELLKNNLYSPNWYIRFNSAESLEKMGVTYLELVDIIDGNDRYAAEILRYRLQKENMRERRSSAV
ncbi:MAG: HEAT repeat domain-containing protein [Emergencia sp.]